MANRGNIQKSQTQMKEESRKTKRVTDQSSQTALDRASKRLPSIDACPVHASDDRRCTCVDDMVKRERENQKVEFARQRSSSRGLPQGTDDSGHDEHIIKAKSLKSCASHNSLHRCTVRVEPTTSCESHFQHEHALNVSMATTASRKYEADDEQTSASTFDAPRKSQTRGKTVVDDEDSVSSLPVLQAPKKISNSELLEESDESFQAPKTKAQPKEERRSVERNQSVRQRSKPQIVDETSEEIFVPQTVSKPRRKHAEEEKSPKQVKTIKIADDEFNSRDSARREESTPHPKKGEVEPEVQMRSKSRAKYVVKADPVTSRPVLIKHEEEEPETQNRSKSRAKYVIEPSAQIRKREESKPRVKNIVEEESPIETGIRSSKHHEVPQQKPTRRTSVKQQENESEDSLDSAHKRGTRYPSNIVQDESEVSSEAVPVRSSTAPQASRSSAKKRIITSISDDERDPICSAVSGNISIPHLCTRKSGECGASCTTHVIKNIDERTRVCACAKKHPELFQDKPKK